MTLLSTLRTAWNRLWSSPEPAFEPVLLPDRRLSHRSARIDRLSSTSSLGVIALRLAKGGDHG
jgi:hypothetical protein